MAKKIGRPKKIAVFREPNGRISRAKQPAGLIAILARAKHNRLSIIEAAGAEAGSFLGRLLLMGETNGITRQQYEAANRFLRLLNDYKKSILSLDAHYETRVTVSVVASAISKEESYNRWCRHIKKQFEDLYKLIYQKKEEHGNKYLLRALSEAIIADFERPLLIKEIKVLCNLFIDFFTDNIEF